MKKINWNSFVGFGILLVLAVSYFIKIEVDSGSNFVVNDSLLGIVIFHNPFVLGLYVLIGGYFLIMDLKKK